jgi:phosphate transport system protein
MSKHFERDLENLQHRLLALSGTVEDLVVKANQALLARDVPLAEQVVRADGEVDQQEVEIEDECLKMLALHQPVALDLRRIATVMKVNNDLERIADLAVNVAQRAESLREYPQFTAPARLDQMGQSAMGMVRRSLDALVEMDAAAARAVCADDDAVDELNRAVTDELVEIMQRDSWAIPAALHCFSAARHLERIADHATNIAEDVLYLVEGEIARHSLSRR